MPITEVWEIVKENLGYILFTILGALFIGGFKQFKYKYIEKEKRSYHSLYLLYCWLGLPIVSVIFLLINLDALADDTGLSLGIVFQLGISSPVMLNSLLTEGADISALLGEKPKNGA